MTTDEEIQEGVRAWITQKVAHGHTVARAFADILKNADKNVRTIGAQIAEKRVALEGVEPDLIEKALEPFYIVARREERILINAKALQKSGWNPEAA